MNYTFLDYTDGFCNQDTFCKSVIGTSPHNDLFHLHPHYEFLCTLERRNHKMIAQDQAYYIDYPCIIIQKPFILHNNYLLDEPQSRAHIFYFTEDWINGFRSNHSTLSMNDFFGNENVCVFDIGGHIELFGKCLELFDMYPGNSKAQEHIFILILETVLMLNLENRYRQVCSPKFPYIREIMLDMVSCFGDPRKLDDYSRKYYVSSTKLYRDFKNYTGITFKQFSVLIRLNEAKKLLGENKYSINRIALMLGFSDPTYFYPFFKKYTGMSPRAYVKGRQKEKRE